jgi:pyrimidine operon attenuation protein/uracil phosphoribosyltransferase
MSTQKEKALILDRAGIDRALTRIAHEILEKNRGAKELGLIGIQRGGVHLARRLAKKIREIEGVEPPVGSLDITMYRDDLGIRASPVPKETIFLRCRERVIVLVDDVLFTGRIIRRRSTASWTTAGPGASNWQCSWIAAWELPIRPIIREGPHRREGEGRGHARRKAEKRW